MSAATVTVRQLSGGTDLDRFIRLPWRIYRRDPLWVAPLIADVRALLTPEHPFHQHAELALFLAWRESEPVGRIAAVVNRAYNDFHQDTVGFFGLFECENDERTARALLETAEGWLKERGMTSVQGPMNLSTNEELGSPGLVIEGGEHPPVIMMGHTPPYYVPLVEGAGYGKSKDLLCYWVDGRSGTPQRLLRALERAQRAEHVTIRPVDMRRFKAEVQKVQEIYNTAWERNWGFIPMTPAEIDYMAKHLKPVIYPELCPLAYIDDEPVAFAIALPDYHQALRHLNGRLLPFGIVKLLWYRRKIDAVRVLTLGVKPEHRQKGIDGMLIGHIFRESARLNMAQGECSWILEDNVPMRKGIERVGGTVYKTYRVYQKELAS